MGSAALGTQRRGGLASEVVQILDRLIWEEIVWMLWWQGSLCDQEAARWVLCDTTLKGMRFCRWPFISGLEDLWLTKMAFKSVICPHDITAFLLPSTLQNSHLLFLSCCHILEGKEASWRKRRGGGRVGGLLLIRTGMGVGCGGDRTLGDLREKISLANTKGSKSQLVKWFLSFSQSLSFWGLLIFDVYDCSWETRSRYLCFAD